MAFGEFFRKPPIATINPRCRKKAGAGIVEFPTNYVPAPRILQKLNGIRYAHWPIQRSIIGTSNKHCGFYMHLSARSGSVAVDIGRVTADKRVTNLWAQVAELVDALASGASVRTDVEVRVLFWAPMNRGKRDMFHIQPLNFVAQV